MRQKVARLIKTKNHLHACELMKIKAKYDKHMNDTKIIFLFI